MAPLLDDYFKKLAGNLILQTHEAIRSQDFQRAHDCLDDLSAIFVGKAPGMLENHVEK